MWLEAPKKSEVAPVPVGESKPERTDASSAPIRCRACAHVITHVASRREVAGRHEHLRLNPSAFAFIFGCFSSAPGCLVNGEPTEEATWFAGCRWQYAHCGQCLAHLGWAFTGADSFFGLLLERLVEG
jgi:hypothetical protein